MVTNSLYKNYSNQIAKLFCTEQVNKILCEASISERLNTYLDDYTYPIFLSRLAQGRGYITNVEAFQNNGFRVVLIDLITGERVTAWWDIPYSMPYYGKLAGKLLSHKYEIISANKTFSQQNATDIRITWNAIKPSYGITFVPGNVGTGGGGSSGSGGSGSGGGGGGQITQTGSGQTQAQTQAAGGFNFQEILSNPLILVGVGLAFYFLLIKK